MSYSYQRGFSWPLVLFVIVLAVMLLGLFSQVFIEWRRDGALSTAGSNTKAIAGALNLFRQEYGSYPDQDTRQSLLAKGHDHLSDGDDANAYLAQLLVAGFLDREADFFVPRYDGIRKGDEETSRGNLLSAGENGFAYLMTDEDGSLGSQASIMPLVITPAIRGGRDPRFDPETFGGIYIYGAVDGSSKQGDIAEDGRAMSKGRSHLFELGPDSLFGSDIPVVKMPLVD